LTDRLAELPKGVPATTIYRKMKEFEAKRSQEEASLQRMEDESRPGDLPAPVELFQKFLESLRGMGELNQTLKDRITRRLVQKIEVTPTTYRLHFHVGANYIERGSRIAR